MRLCSDFFRLEYTVNSLSDKLGVPPPVRLPTYDDDTWEGVLEEVLPYLERQWSSAAKNKLFMLESMPEDALEGNQRDALRMRQQYVERLESLVTNLSESDLVSAVNALPLSFSERASDETYIAELEEAVAMFSGKFLPFGSATW